MVLCVNRVEATLPRSSQRCHLVLGGAHEEARRELPPDADPAGYVVILPDWGGLVSRRYGARRTGRAAAIVVVDEDPNINGLLPGRAARRGGAGDARAGLSVFYDSAVARHRAHWARRYHERRAAIREGRTRTPDRQGQILMREALKQKLKECPVHVQRSEVEAMGEEMGLEGIEAARLFDRLKGVSWRGDYVRSDTGWVAAWVREVD